VIGLHLLFPSVARLGWLTTTVDNPHADAARATVFLLRGQTAVFSRSFGSLCDRFRQAGVWAEDCRCIGDRWVFRFLADRVRQRAATPIIFIGHSRGGRRAIQVATTLATVGIGVDLLIGVDVAFAPPLPESVRKAVHIYRSRRRLYPARPFRRVDAVHADTTSLTNIDLDAPGSPLAPDGLHHLNITRSPRVGDWLFDRVMSEIGST